MNDMNANDPTSAAREARLARLYARLAHGIKPGLDATRALLATLGNPERGLATVHVAGTNGKGSTCAMVAKGLEALGLPVGLTTSPHLVRFNERFQINGSPISDEELDRHLAAVEEAAVRVERDAGIVPTFFECALAIAFLHFREHSLKLAVVETGMGGRLDATNILVPMVSVITRIAMDHMQYLGDTLEKIAAEKAGIVKPGRPVVAAAMPEEALAVVAEAARKAGSPLVVVPEAVTVRRVSGDLAGQRVAVSTAERDYGTLRTPLAAAYQLENIATAVATLETLRSRVGLPLPENAVAKALAEVRWPGRMQLVRDDPPIVLDGAHNPDGAAALSASLKAAKVRKGSVSLVCGFCADKDVDGFFRTMSPWIRRAWCVPIRNPRSLAPEAAAAKAARFRIAAEPCASFGEALPLAEAAAREEDGPVFVCGSLFLVGEALERLADAPPTPFSTNPSARSAT